MDTTEVNKADLLETLKKNRAAHEKEFKSAKGTWQKKATKALKKASTRAVKKGMITFTPLEGLPKPTHYLKSYDVMIARLEREVNKTVELDDREFRSYVLDDWDWKNQFMGTTQLYNTI